MDLLAATDAATVVTAVATVVLTVVTMMYVRLTHQLVRAQTEPYVVVYVQNRPDLELRELIEIVIENIGNGVAKGVTFTTSEKIHCRFLARDATQIMVDGPLIGGIAALGPKQKRVILWGTFDEISQKHRRPIRITARFKGTGWLVPSDPEPEVVESILDIDSLAHNELRFDDGTWHCARYLREIREILGQSRPQ